MSYHRPANGLRRCLLCRATLPTGLLDVPWGHVLRRHGPGGPMAYYWAAGQRLVAVLLACCGADALWLTAAVLREVTGV